jgi:hypothetical protein
VLVNISVDLLFWCAGSDFGERWNSMWACVSAAMG